MLQSWVFGANDPEIGFGLNHLPLTAFFHEASVTQRLGVGIGACVLDLACAASALPASISPALSHPFLNEFLALGPSAWLQLRTALQHLLSLENRDPESRRLLEAALLPTRTLDLRIPCLIGDYTDFYASRHHARRVGELFRPEQPLLPNYDWVPIAYHGRASSIVPGGTPIPRPFGQQRAEPRPIFAPTQRLDYELELGLWVGTGNELGQPVPLAEADSHLFGVSLLNDWSARDLQAWESQPLGPFLAKNFASSISPWITPLAALEPFRTAPPSHPETLPYLEGPSLALALTVEALLSTPASRAASLPPFRLSAAESSSLYWTPAQMLTHHTSNGCNLRPGDLLGTGTISGEQREQAGCLLELTRGGAEPILLPNGETRTFLQDGDELTLTAHAQQQGALPVRLGTCSGRILPAP